MKKTVTFLLTLALLISCLAIPGTLAEDRVAEHDDGMTYATGYPITKEVIELDVIVMGEPAMRPHMADTKVLDYIEERTNIRLNIRTLSDDDQRGLIFASRDYPDFAMNIRSTDQQRLDAAEAGDLVALEPLIDEFAPTWRAFFDEYRLAYHNALGADGTLYTLPWCNFAPYDRNLRDMFMVNRTWCEELGLELPTTLAEFKDVLIAFRDNAGTGSIPAVIEPLHFFKDNQVGGYVDFFNFFGLIVSTGGNHADATNADFLSVVDGEVKYQAIDPDAKEVLKYLADLYAEGLITPESFTDTWDMHLAKLGSPEPTVGAYFAFGNNYPNHFSTIAPLDAENGKSPTIRRQTYTANPNHAFMMFEGNPYPVATIRLLEFWVDDLVDMMNVTVGMQDHYWEFNADGKAIEMDFMEDENGRRLTAIAIRNEEEGDMQGYWNSFAGLRTPDFYENDFYEMQNDAEYTRAWSYENFYKDYIYDESYSFMGGALSSDDNVYMAELATEINTLRKTTFANWISGIGDIDAEWDDFVKKTYDYGLEEYLALRQKAFDLLSAQ